MLTKLLARLLKHIKTHINHYSTSLMTYSCWLNDKSHGQTASMGLEQKFEDMSATSGTEPTSGV